MTNILKQNSKKQRKPLEIYTHLCGFLFMQIILNFFSINSAFAQNLVRNITIDRGVTPNPLLVDGVSGGSLAALEVVRTEQTATGYCDGFVNQQPNHTLTLKKYFDFLKIEVDSSADTTIVVQGPGGIWCNDDTNYTNPAIEGQWQPGVYKIWIGSYEENVVNDYRIKISGN